MAELLVTERLALHLIKPDDLVQLYEDSIAFAVSSSAPYTNPYRVLIDDPGPLRWLVPKVKTDPQLNIWFVRWIVLKATQEIIGSISFHDKPDERGMIEIGLGVHSDFRCQGFAHEALLGMWTWVINQHGVKILRYVVNAQNAPSLKIISHFGFQHVGQRIDAVDGQEEIFELSAQEFGVRFGKPQDSSS